MIRLVGILVGLGFTAVVLWSFFWGALTAASEGLGEETAEHAFHLAPDEGIPGEPEKHPHFSFEGPLGHWDVAQLQRGLKVYSEVCSACHSLRLVHFRDLEQIGYDESQVKAFAATKQVPGIDPVTGEANMRPGLPTDAFPSPYANDVAARAANNNAIPPDLSLMTKARHHGTHYVYSLLTGYRDPSTYKNKHGETLAAAFPESMPSETLHFNPYFANLNLAMVPPLSADGQVTYDDGTEATIHQMSEDVAAFLTWTAEPALIKRKQTGWAVLGFLLFATILAWFAKKQVWANAKPGAKRREDD